MKKNKGVSADKTMNAALWARISEFQFDAPGTARTFAAKLTHDTGWTADFTARAIAEYRRYLYLAMEAGHPVSPSMQVDEVWHLHLMYTSHYWDVLCKEVLGRPLHHGPSRGGEAEALKFDYWYKRTLESYRLVFGEAPPEDLWPAPEQRFVRTTVLVDRTTHWVIPKPRWLKSLREALSLVGLTALISTMLPPAAPSWAASASKKSNGDAIVYMLAALGAYAVFSVGRWFIETPEGRAARLERQRQNRSNGGCSGGGGCSSSSSCGGGCGGGCG